METNQPITHGDATIVEIELDMNRPYAVNPTKKHYQTNDLLEITRQKEERSPKRHLDVGNKQPNWDTIGKV